MRKEQLIELTRRVAQISGVELPIICGSQAVFAHLTLAPEIVSRSVECDYLFTALDRETRNRVLDQIGIDSEFREREGYYADPLGLFTVVLPPCWQERLKPLTDEDGRVVAYCTELYDTAFSKLIAGREKDFEFLDEIIMRGLLDLRSFAERIRAAKELPQATAIASRLERLQNYLSKSVSRVDLRPIRELLQRWQRERNS